MKKTSTYDDILKQRLGEYDSPVSGDMFEHIMSKRAISNKLENYESHVSGGIFDRIMAERIISEDLKAGNTLEEKIMAYESPTPVGMFDNIMAERALGQNSDNKTAFEEKILQYESAVPSDMFDRIMQQRDTEPKAIWWQDKRWALVALLLLLVSGVWYLKNNDFNKNTLKNIVHTEGVSENSLNTKIEDKKSKLTSIATQHSNTYTINETTKTTYKPQKQAVPKTIAPVTVSNTTIITQNSTANASNANSTTASQLPSQQTYPSELTPSNTNELKNNSITVVAPLSKYYQNPILSIQNKENPLNDLKCLTDPGDGCPTFGKRTRGRRWYVDAYGAPELALRRLNPNSIEYNDYKAARDTIEKSWYAFSSGVRLSAVFDNNIALRAGIAYNQGNEIFQRDSGKQQILVITDLVTKDTLGYQIINGIVRQTRYNRYRSVDLMLQGGYEMPLNDNLTLGFNGGANFNIMSSQKATILSQAGQPMPVSASDNIFKRNIGISLFGSVAGYYQLRERLQLVVEPNIRYGLRPITQASYPLRQSYTTASLIIGLRYKL